MLLFFSTYIFSPLLTFELFSQFRFSKGYFYDKFISINTAFSKTNPVEFGFKSPNKETTNTIQTLYPDYQEEKYIKLRTDEFGTIEPSSLHSQKNRIGESIVFCGGSTTETFAVQEGRRVPDVFSRITKIPSVNAGKSGKDLGGCIKSIEFILSNIGNPRMIFVANNVNTMGKFASLKSKKPFGLRFLFRAILPGIYNSLAEIYSTLSKSEIDLPPYEIYLRKGCCHEVSTFNKTKQSRQFDWNNNKNLEEYYNFVFDQGKILKDMLNSYEYNLKKLIIFMEPNSFLNSKTSALYDFRQFLTNIEGEILNGLESAKITKNYDLQYKLALKSIGFEIITVDPKDLREEYFYDAVHLSPEGAEFIANFYAIHLN